MPSPAATFGYRGADLLARRTVGLPGQPVAATGSFGYDPARRLVSALYSDPTTRAILDQATAWTARGLLAVETWGDRNGRQRSFGYDPAGRLRASGWARRKRRKVAVSPAKARWVTDDERPAVDRLQLVAVC